MVRHPGDRAAAGAVLSLDPALEAAEAAARRAVFRGLPGGRVLEVDGWAVRSWPSRPQRGEVAALGEVSEASLDAALAAAAPGRVVVQLPAGALDGEYLRRRGLRSLSRRLRLLAPAQAPLTPPGLWLEQVGPQGGGDVSAVLRQGFGDDEPWWWVAPLGAPGWTQLVAYDGDAPVATGALHATGDVAWVGRTSTLPAARGRGLQAALLAYRLGLARELGASRVVAQADLDSPSHRNLLRVGFELAYHLERWVRDA